MSWRRVCTLRFAALAVGILFGFGLFESFTYMHDLPQNSNIRYAKDLLQKKLASRSQNVPTTTLKTFTEAPKDVPEHCKPYLDIFKGDLKPVDTFPSAQDCPRWRNWIKEARECVLKEMNASKNVWNDLSDIVDCCTATLKELLRAFPLEGKDDVKYILFPTDLNEPCRALSLGIGSDTGPETKLKTVMEQCELYGVDADSKIIADFELLGEFSDTIVSGRSEPKMISQLSENGSYVETLANATGLAEFLENEIHQNEIDYLFVDMEGAEYSILEEFLTKASLAEGNLYEIEICHVTFEFHEPLEKYNMTLEKFNRLLSDFFQQTGFIPLWSPPKSAKKRMFVTNALSDYCIERYFYQWCKNPG